jgi:hypothetical protein
MSSIELKTSHVLPTAKSSDGKIMFSYVFVALAIVLVLFLFSGNSQEPNAVDISSMTIFP